tara:strand:+ start:65 stop:1480 length:1416 start_codon:yes stop_codon:yes gene_type:complete
MEHRSLTFIIGLLFSALAVSGVAAYFSIVGLMAIFNGLPYSILAMGIVLEIAKLITASWIYQYWSRVKFLMKTYMVLAVVILSIITSVGIFGFLSKAHIEQSGLAGNAGAEVTRIEQLIEREQGKIQVAEERIERIEAGGTLDITESIRQQEEIRDTAWDRVQGDITYAENQIESIRANLNTDIDQKEQELAELDAIVESYTSQGTTGNLINRTDNVAKGIEVRESQRVDREAIADEIDELRSYAETQIASYRNQIAEYRADTQTTIDNANAEINRLRDNETSSQDDKDEQIDNIQLKIDESYNKIDEYNVTLFDKRSIVRELEQEVGPIKYVAQLIYGDDSANSIDSAVLILIMMLIFVFDPLAIVLVIAANLSFKERSGQLITPVKLDDDVVDFKQELPEEPVLDRQTTIGEQVGMDDDIHIELTTDSPKEEVIGEDWVSDKYGEESAMDPKKEKNLQWLIDKKLRLKE